MTAVRLGLLGAMLAFCHGFRLPSSPDLSSSKPLAAAKMADAAVLDRPVSSLVLSPKSAQFEIEYRRHREQGLYYPKKVEVISHMEPYAAAMMKETLLETGEKSWQPQDFVPDLGKEGWEEGGGLQYGHVCAAGIPFEEVHDLRKQAENLNDELLVVLVGDCITEEALPTYFHLLNTFEGVDDNTGTSQSAWAAWSRAWTSEENRHGDLLNRYLYLSGRVDMRAIEVTIQHLITNGFDPKIMKDPYRGFVYTSFQERATKISHQNVAKLANAAGDKRLAKICSKIAGDEARHEKAYQAFVKKILELDPEGGIMAFYDMMQDQITMPACLMTDGKEPKLFDKFSVTAQKIDVYTAFDYVEILEHLLKTWDIEHITGLTGVAAEAQERLMKLPARYKKLAEWARPKLEKQPKSRFSWIYDREA